MNYILQVDFPHDGIFGEEFSKAFVDLANDIATEDGLLWKIWTENETTKEAGEFIYFQMKLMQKNIWLNTQLDLKVLDTKILEQKFLV